MTFVLLLIQLEGVTQSIGTYNLQFSCPDYNATQQTICVDIQIQSANSQTLTIGDYEIIGTYNTSALSLNEETSYTPLGFTPNINCNSSSSSPYSEVSFSILDDSLYTILGTIDSEATACHEIGADWENIGTLCFSVENEDSTTTQNFSSFLSANFYNENGIPHTFEMEIDSNAFPIPEITISKAVCEGIELTTLTVESNFDDYVWTDESGGFVGFNTPLTISDAGAYTLQVFDDFSDCMISQTVSIQNGLILTPEDSTICLGDTIILNANVGFDTYIWKKDGVVLDNSFVSEDYLTVMVIDTGTYTLEVFDGVGCFASDTIIITSSGNLAIDITGDLAICGSDSTLLDAGAGFEHYLWTYENGDTIVETTASILSVDSIGIYTVQVFDGGCMGTDMVEVSIDQSLTVDILGNLTICGSETTTLSTATSFDRYAWTGEDGMVLDTLQNLFVDSIGTYFLSVDSAGCVATGEVMVSLSDNLSIDITGHLMVCEGGTTLLNATPGFEAYTWTDASGNTMSSSPSLLVDTPGVYTVEVSNDMEACFGTATVTIDLDESLTVAITSTTDALTICEGETVTLVGEVGFEIYEWRDENDELIGTAQTLVAEAKGIYKLTATTEAGCSATNLFTLGSRSNLPIEITGSLTICPEGTTELNANPGFASYTWTNENDSIVGTEQSLSLAYPGIYTVKAVDATGCFGKTTEEIIIDANLAVDIAGDLMICAGEITFLDAGVGIGATYEWTNENEVISTQQNIGVSNLGMYKVEISKDGCFGADSVIVSGGGGTLVVDIAGNETFCSVSQATLRADVYETSYIWTSGSGTYAWYNQSNTIVGQNQILNTDIGGTYTVVVTDANGCTGTDMFTITPSNSLTIDITGDLAFCEGSSTTLTASGGVGTYLWYLEGNDIALGGLPNYTITEAGTYTVDMFDDNGCTGSETVIVTKYEVPNVVITNGIGDTINEITFCQGSSAVNLHAVASEGAGIYNYMWSNNSISSTITVNESNSYTVTVTDANNCPAIDTVSVSQIVSIPTTITDNLGNANNLTFCQGESVTLEVDLPEGDYTYMYEWSNYDLTPTTTINTPGTSTHTVSITRDDGCSGTDAITLTQSSTTPLTFAQNRFVFITEDNQTLNLYFSFENDVFNIDIIEAEIPLLDSQTLSVIDAFDNGSPIIDSANNSFIVYAPSIDFIGFDSTWVSVCTQSCYTCDSTWIVMGNYGGGTPIETTFMNPTTLIEEVLASDGCVGIDNITSFGAPNAIGYFANGDSAIGLQEGIVLSTGPINNIGGLSTTNLNTDLTVTEGNTAYIISDDDLEDFEDFDNSNNAAGIIFDFTPTTDTIEFEFVFASEEYPDSNQTNPLKNDAFGIFISGPGISGPFSNNAENITLVPNSSDYVSVNTINDIENSNFYNDNTGGLDIKFDGFTDILTARLVVQACQTYHIKIVIADESDGNNDSALFIKANSLGSEVIEPSISGNLSLYAGENTTLEVNTASGYNNYNWSTTETTQAITINEVGDYTVTVSNVAGCYCDASVTVNQANTTTAEIELRTYLEGASTNIISIADLFNGMTNTLQTTGILPLQQPYNMPPWNYSGTEIITNFNNLDIVDWVLVELYAIGEEDTIIAGRKAALLQTFGNIIDTNGESKLYFSGINPSKDYYIVLRHRNHLDIVSAEAYDLSSSLYVDFADPDNVMQGSNQLTQVGSTAIYAMRAGDFNGNGVFEMTDYTRWLAASPQFNVYAIEDCNLDGLIFTQDYHFWFINNAIIGVDMIRY